jgi:hypothetical protein
MSYFLNDGGPIKPVQVGTDQINLVQNNCTALALLFVGQNPEVAVDTTFTDYTLTWGVMYIIFGGLFTDFPNSLQKEIFFVYG